MTFFVFLRELKYFLFLFLSMKMKINYIVAADGELYEILIKPVAAACCCSVEIFWAFWK